MFNYKTILSVRVCLLGIIRMDKGPGGVQRGDETSVSRLQDKRSKNNQPPGKLRITPRHRCGEMAGHTPDNMDGSRCL